LGSPQGSVAAALSPHTFLGLSQIQTSGNPTTPSTTQTGVGFSLFYRGFTGFGAGFGDTKTVLVCWGLPVSPGFRLFHMNFWGFAGRRPQRCAGLP